MPSEKLAVTEEPGKTTKNTLDGLLLAEQRDQKNYGILRDSHQRDRKTSNKGGIEMTTTESTLSIDNADLLKSSQPQKLE